MLDFENLVEHRGSHLQSMEAFRDLPHGGCHFLIVRLLETSRCICSCVSGSLGYVPVQCFTV